MPDTAVMICSLDELWLLQRCVRHEMANQKEWKFPLTNLDLNDAIAEALLFCVDESVDEAALILSWGDCLIIDAVVPSDAKDINGKKIGRELLLKSFRARREIRRAIPCVEEAYIQPFTRAEVVAKLATVETSKENDHVDTERDGSPDYYPDYYPDYFTL